MYTFADIFSGCGGLTHGFYKHKDFKGLLAVDHWPIAGKVFSDNHPDMPFEIRDLYDSKEIETVSNKLKDKCDVLLGGPPCQGFSTMGKRRENDKRCSLVESYLQICLSVKPKVIILENVWGITSKRHCSGLKYPEFITRFLEEGNKEVKYDTNSFLVNTLNFGVAQTRNRWIFIAVRTDLNEEFNYLEKIVKGIEDRKTQDVKTLRDVIGDLPLIKSGEGANEMVVNKVDGQQIIYNHKAMNHSARLLERFSYVPVGGGLLDVPRELLTDHLQRMLDGEYGDGGHIKNIYGRMDWSKPSGTIVAGMDKITCGRFVHPEVDRLLTPRECARIQSFPDDFKFSGSMVNQYYLIGNAVPPKISEVLADSLAESLGESN